MAIPDIIKSLANKVRNEIYGRNVRESIARSMEVTGETADTAKKTADEQLKRVDRLIRENPQPSEVVDARGNHPLLGDRLDSFTSQLAQKAPKTYVDENVARKANKSEVLLKAEGVGLDDAKEDLLAAIQNKEGETNFNLLSIPRDSTVNRNKLTSIVNLYDVNEVVDGTFYRDDGTIVNNVLASSTPAYPVPGGREITIKIPKLSQSISHYLVFFDSEDNAVTSVSKNLTTGSTTQSTTIYLTVPYGVSSFRLSLEKASKENYQIYYKQEPITSDLIETSTIDLINDISNNTIKGKVQLFDGSQIIEGIYYRNDGTIGSRVDLGTTKKIFVPKQKIVTIVIPKLNISSLSSFLTFWDKSDNVITGISREEVKGNNTNEVTITFKMPDEVSFFTFPIELANKNNYEIYTQTITSRLYGKMVNFIGDSITQGQELIDGQWVIVKKTYAQHLKEKLGLLEARNHGIASTAISAQSDYANHTNALINRWMKLDTNVDLNVVFMGTNDFGHNTPLGTMSDRTDVSFYGALHVIIPGMIETYSRAKLLFMTPLHRDRPGDNNETNSLGISLKQYVDAIIEVCNYYGVEVIDAYRISGFNPVIPYIKNTYMPDGLHLNDLGHEKLADNIVGRFEIL